MIKIKIIPKKSNIIAMAFYPFLFVRRGFVLSEKTINHEKIHFKQQKELILIFFYIWYILEWTIRSIWHFKDAYRKVSFEREAYQNENDFDYLKNRKMFSFIKYL